jgi:hypothetical protein
MPCNCTMSVSSLISVVMLQRKGPAFTVVGTALLCEKTWAEMLKGLLSCLSNYVVFVFHVDKT